MAKSVLIVDDEEPIRRWLRQILSADGLDVKTAEDGHSALELARDSMPDLVLLDVMMPGQDGIEVCQILRSMEGGEAVKIIMLSARTRPVEIEKGLAMGADAYLTKPFSLSDVREKLRALIADPAS